MHHSDSVLALQGKEFRHPFTLGKLKKKVFPSVFKIVWSSVIEKTASPVFASFDDPLCKTSHHSFAHLNNSSTDIIWAAWPRCLISGVECSSVLLAALCKLTLQTAWKSQWCLDHTSQLFGNHSVVLRQPSLLIILIDYFYESWLFLCLVSTRRWFANSSLDSCLYIGSI